MKEPIRLDVYREVPKPVPLRGRVHAPVCKWCEFYSFVNSQHTVRLKHVCNFFRPTRLCNDLNDREQCDRYYPSLWTRILQALRLRPFVERRRDG